MRRTRIVALALALLPAGGCLLGPDYERRPVETPATWLEQAPPGEVPEPAAGFALFADPALDELIATAFARNLDLAAAWWRIEQARAQLGVARAEAYPSFGYSASASGTEPSELVAPNAGTVEDYTAALGVAWEIDLFGRLRRSTEAARAELLASEEGRRALALTLAASVADTYFTLLALDDQLAIAQRTLAGRRDSTSLIRSRFEGGIASELEVHQAEIEEATAESAVPQIERARGRAETALRLLLAQPPGPIVRGTPLAERPLPPDVPVGLPSDLLERRPDVLAAEASAHAATARVGAAEALRWPSISLTGAVGVESPELSDLTSGDASFWNLAGNLVGPLFEFGKNKRRAEAARAAAEQAVLAWQQAALASFRDVEDALVDLRTSRLEQAARERQAGSANAAVRLSRARYDGGVTSYLEVLDLERSQFNAELQESSARQATFASLVRLLKALGGGWAAPAPVSAREASGSEN
ncbi:MAG: efflux transporter outer membrane subunit [Acidobacteria bacterium]|nr:efflux transporter outer membrane subunit [Acidobacteriota bacterium]